MTLYHQAPFTVDALHPIGDEPPPAVGIDETGQADELALAADEYAVAVAGPLGLTIDDGAPMELIVTVEGADDADTLALGWGDGTLEDLVALQTRTRAHTYAVEGNKNIAVQGTVDGRQYAIAKDRWVTDAPV